MEEQKIGLFREYMEVISNIVEATIRSATLQGVSLDTVLDELRCIVHKSQALFGFTSYPILVEMTMPNSSSITVTLSDLTADGTAKISNTFYLTTGEKYGKF